MYVPVLMLLLSVVFGMSYKEFLGFGILYGKSWIAKYKEICNIPFTSSTGLISFLWLVGEGCLETRSMILTNVKLMSLCETE